MLYFLTLEQSMLKEVTHRSDGSSLIWYWVSALSAPWHHLGAVRCQCLPPSSPPRLESLTQFFWDADGTSGWGTAPPGDSNLQPRLRTTANKRTLCLPNTGGIWGAGSHMHTEEWKNNSEYCWGAA